MDTRRVLALLVVIATAAGVAPAPTAPSRTWLWAWERPEDLRFLAGRDDVGVAFLAATIDLHPDAIAVRRRAHPVRIPDDVPRIAVIRIERPLGLQLADEAATRAAVIEVLREVAALPRVTGVQLDHDARLSERPFYLHLLADARAAIPRGSTLSMTALASWCLDDAWLDDAKRHVDSIVPMTFAMGPDERWVRARLELAPFDDSGCRAHLGIDVAEPRPPRRGAELWAFSSDAWTPQRFAAISQGDR